MANAAAISRVATRWMIAGEWRAHPTRVIVAALAIAVGVALGFAVHLINASALDEFARAVKTVNGDADLQVHAVTPLGFDETLYPRLARTPGIAAVSPVVELPLTTGANVSLTLLGVDPFRAAMVTPSLIGRRIASAAQQPAPSGTDAQVSMADQAFDENAVYLSQAALAATGKHIGETIEFFDGGNGVGFVIAGILPGVAEGQSLAVTDIAAAQWRFGRLGRLQRIDVKLAEGSDVAQVRSALAAVLPADAEIVSETSEARRTDSLSRAYRVNLDMLSLMALLTGAFLAFSAQALSVARRRSQFALLRVLGMQRRALLVQVLLEGGIVGGVGAGAGLGLGLLLAQTALRFLGGDLGGRYFSGSKPNLIFAPGAALAFFALGVLAALIGSVLPARDAARAQPAVALKDAGDAADPRSPPGARIAFVLLSAGVAAAFLPAAGGLPLFGYFAIALLLAGGVAAMPLLARLLLAPLQHFAFRVPAHLASKHLWGAPSQAAIALCGIVASTSLMIAMAVMVASFRTSVDNWLVQILPADIYLRVEGDDYSAFSPDVQQRLAATPGIAAIHFRKLTPLRLSPDEAPIAWVAADIDPAAPGKTLPMIGAALRVPQGATPIWLSEPATWLYRYRPGDVIALPLAKNGGMTKVFVAGIWRDYGRQQGSIAMNAKDYVRLTGDMMRSDAAVTLAPGSAPSAVIEAMRARLAPSLAARVEFAPSRALRDRSLEIFDRSFAVTYVLEAIAILVGLTGVAATVSAQTLARTKEFGMLRHIGVLRRQIVAMLAAEGALLGAVGVIAGIGLGIAISQVLIHVINPQSFHWTMETRLPLAVFAIVTIALMLASAGTALLAGRRALSSDAVRAVREDW
ncbi:MAG TPA: ABC transporter permease [Micropepsaceae bacterium]